MRNIVGAATAVLLLATGCGAAGKMPAAKAHTTPAAAQIKPTLPTSPVSAPPGGGTFAAEVNTTGVGPAHFAVRLTPGQHKIYVQFACSGPGSATVTNTAGRRLLAVVVKSSDPHCKPGWAYGGTWSSTTQADQSLHLAVAPSMTWALQVWVQ